MVSCIICDKETEDTKVLTDGFIYLDIDKGCFVCSPECFMRYMENLRKKR